MRVLVTGANGFVGLPICRRLLAEKWSVAVAMRGAHAMPKGVETHIVEALGPSTNWANALAGVDAVVHLAGRAHVMHETEANPAALFRRVNTEGTLHLAREAVKAGVRHFVFMSSIKVNGEATRGEPFTFENAPEPIDDYGRSKRDAEEGLAQLVKVAGGHFRATVFRPPLIYGPNVKGNFLSLLRAVDRGWPLPLGAIHNRRSLLFVENLADAVAVSLREPSAAYETFLISDGEDVSTPDLIRRIAKLMGRPARLLPISSKTLVRVAGAFGREAAARRLTESLVVRDTSFRPRFGWNPPFTLDRGLADTVSWFKQTKLT